MPIELINKLLAIATIGGQIMVVAVLGWYWLVPTGRARLLALAKQWSLPAALVVAVLAIGFSLFYSEIMDYAPCSLCWWQRVFLYPLPLILLVGWWRRDRFVSYYGLSLLVVGSIFSLYQVYLQYGGTPLGVCGVDSLSCNVLYVYEFGYVTIPLMALTGFVMLITLLLGYERANRN